ncbi:MAG TPA: PPE domain-containing protein [Mycobacterium sp.]|nr:PPE domain-containing protein [Mycobacterium sp.]
MDFALIPPEINSARMYAGPGSGPMLAAAAAWDGLAAELGSAAAGYQSVLSNLTGEWRGPASMSMGAAAAPYVAWMNTTATQAGQAATQAKAAAAAYETAFAMTVPPPVIATNRALLAALVATNFLGQNTAAIAAAEAHYGEMWAQDATAMYGYAGSAAAATDLTPFTQPKQNTNPGGLGSQPTASQATTTVAQTLQGLSQPLQSSSTSGMGQMAMTGAAATSGKGALKGAAAAGTGAGVTAGSYEGAGAPGLAMDAVGLGTELVGLGPVEGGGLGIEFGGLAIELAGMDALPGIGLGPVGALGGLGLLGSFAPAGGMSLMGSGVSLMGGVGPLGGLAGAGGAGAAWAGMGQAASLGSLSVPQAWTAAAPPVIRQIALASAESSMLAVTAPAANVPYAEMALAGMAGRAMTGVAGRGFRERMAAPARRRSEPAEQSLEGPPAGIGIVAELRGLAELRDCGILTEEEFTQEKQRLLNR